MLLSLHFYFALPISHHVDQMVIQMAIQKKKPNGNKIYKITLAELLLLAFPISNYSYSFEKSYPVIVLAECSWFCVCLCVASYLKMYRMLNCVRSIKI